MFVSVTSLRQGVVCLLCKVGRINLKKPAGGRGGQKMKLVPCALDRHTNPCAQLLVNLVCLGIMIKACVTVVLALVMEVCICRMERTW